MSDEIELGEESSWSDYDSGPFCVHWSDPSECDSKCENCGHDCCRHNGGHSVCNVDGCECEQFTGDFGN